MKEAQAQKIRFRQTKEWKAKKESEKLRAGGKDEITQKPLRKGWQLHHNCLDESQYQNLQNSFLCCNNLTHKFIHWLFVYYKKDRSILDRIRKELEEMVRSNEEKNSCRNDVLGV